jgi:hypothetical protein
MTRVTGRIAGIGGACLAAALALFAFGDAQATDAAREFAKGTTIVGVQVNGGSQNNIQHEPEISGLDFIGLQARASYLPFEPIGSSWYATALEPGLEGWFQYYFHPQQAQAAGLKLAMRLNAVGLGPVVPYLEGLAGAGGTNLDLREIRSEFQFILEGGVGVLYFVAPRVGLNAGYRLQHMSNGNTSRPNRGYNAHTGVFGVSFFFH